LEQIALAIGDNIFLNYRAIIVPFKFSLCYNDQKTTKNSYILFLNASAQQMLISHIVEISRGKRRIWDFENPKTQIVNYGIST
jgi:hypothetical protein